MCLDLENKTAVITGSYGDIGHAIAENFVKNKMPLFPLKGCPKSDTKPTQVSVISRETNYFLA